MFFLLAIGETQMNLSAPINELKRKAKLLRRSEGIPLNQAYARIANEEGYANWGLLIRDYEAQKPKPNERPRTSSDTIART